MVKLLGELRIEEFYKIIFESHSIEMDSAVLEIVERSFVFLKEFFIDIRFDL